MKYLVIAFLLVMPAACASAPCDSPPRYFELADADVAEITDVLETQKAAWNTGDIDGFMEGYWQSPDLRFASGGNVTRGWQETLDRYKANYSDRAKMGTLDFTDIEVNLLSADSAIVHGRWKLTRDSDAPHGLFTLVFREFEGRWLIVSDTTTSGGS